VAVKIRLKRMGKIRQPHYRVVVVDGRKKRDGKVIEEIGKYHPKQEPSFIEVTSDRAQYWLGVGAQPSEAVEAILKITGDWQKFKGLPGTEGTLRVAEPKRDKTELFNEALPIERELYPNDTQLARTLGGLASLAMREGQTDKAIPLAEEALKEGDDLVAFGRPFISNPDLVRRLREGAPLNPWDKNTFYGGGAAGYIDYPALA